MGTRMNMPMSMDTATYTNIRMRMITRMIIPTAMLTHPGKSP